MSLLQVKELYVSFIQLLLFCMVVFSRSVTITLLVSIVSHVSRVSMAMPGGEHQRTVCTVPALSRSRLITSPLAVWWRHPAQRIIQDLSVLTAPLDMRANIVNRKCYTCMEILLWFFIEFIY